MTRRIFTGAPLGGGRLGAESRRRRFLTGKTRLSERELTYFTDIDHVHHEAVTAIDCRVELQLAGR
jgi:hypothetical protein